MDRAKKESTVAELNSTFQKAKVVILSKFGGIDVNTANDLRKKMRESGVDFRVVKNTLAKRAIEGTDYKVLDEHLEGPVVLALSYDDVIAPAKVLDEYLKDGKGLEIQVGVMEGEVLSADEISQLAKLPNLDDSRAMLLGLFMAPGNQLVRTLIEAPASLARLLNSRKDALEKQG